MSRDGGFALPRALEENGTSESGAALAAISRRIVGLLKEHYGKGPTQARTYYSGELVVVLLSGGFTQAERTLIEDGRTRAVMELRAQLQEVMNDRFRQVIEEELQRSVLAFMSAAHYDPDYNAEVFVLAPRGQDDADAPSEHHEEPQYAAEDSAN
ncbi:MAG TPA: Na-translocating system protein MpsC family protein [Solirubrobacteraceae bacterium]